MSRLNRCGAVLCMLFALAITPMAQARTILVATTEIYPFTVAEASSGGVEIDLIRSAFAAVGHEIKVEFFTWPRAMKNVRHGYFDLITSIYYSDERNEFLNYSAPLYQQQTGLMALNSLGLEHFDDLESLRQYRVGIVDGVIISEAFDRAVFLKKITAHRSEVNIERLFEGEVDLVAGTFLHFRSLVDVAGYYDSSRLVLLQPPLAVRASHIAFSRARQGHERLLADFNRGLELIKASGEYQKIWQAHKLPVPDAVATER